jgi:hypothetical protein
MTTDGWREAGMVSAIWFGIDRMSGNCPRVLLAVARQKQAMEKIREYFVSTGMSVRYALVN